MRKIALILCLLLIFTSMPITGFAVDNPNALLVEKIVTEFGTLLVELDDSQLLDLIGIGFSLDNSGNIAPAAYDVVKDTTLQMKLYQAGITRENMSAFIGYVNDALEELNPYDVEAFLNYVHGESSSVPDGLTTLIENVRTDINENIPGMVADLNDNMQPGKVNMKGDFGVDLLSAVYNNMKLIKEDYDESWTVVFSDSFNETVKGVFDTYTTLNLSNSEVAVFQDAFLAIQEEIYSTLEDDNNDGVNSDNIDTLEVILNNMGILDYKLYFKFNSSSSSSSDRQNATVYLNESDFDDSNVLEIYEGWVYDPEEAIDSLEVIFDTVRVTIDTLGTADSDGLRSFFNIPVPSSMDLSVEKTYDEIYAEATIGSSTEAIRPVGYIPLDGYIVDSIVVDNTGPVIGEPDFNFTRSSGYIYVEFESNEDLREDDEFFTVEDSTGNIIADAVNRSYCDYDEDIDKYVLTVRLDKSKLTHGVDYVLVVSEEQQGPEDGITDKAGNKPSNSDDWQYSHPFTYDTRPDNNDFTDYKVYIGFHPGVSSNSDDQIARLYLGEHRFDDGIAPVYGYINSPEETINSLILHFETEDESVTETVNIDDFITYPDGDDNVYFEYEFTYLQKNTTTEYTNVYATINGAQTEYPLGYMWDGTRIERVVFDNTTPVIGDAEFDYTSSNDYVIATFDVDSDLGLWVDEPFKVYNASTTAQVDGAIDYNNENSYNTYLRENGEFELVVNINKDSLTEGSTYILEVSDEITDMAQNPIDPSWQRDWEFTIPTTPTTPDDNDNGGGSSGGGSTTTPPATEEPVTTVPEDDEPVESTVEEVEATENADGQSEATVTEESVTKAVDSIVKALVDAGQTTATKTASVTIPVKSNTENLSVKIPSKAMTNLADNNVGLNIKSDKMEYNVPAGAIDKETVESFGSGVTVQFNSKKMDPQEAFKDMDVDPELASKNKVIELSLDVLDNSGNKVGSISQFKKPLTIKISLDDVDGDPDKLGVYFINPETNKPEFVGGKVVDGMLVFTVSHYSRYAVMEASKTYTDVTDHWSKKYVESMAAKHVVSGYPDGTYLPEKNVTRAEFAKLVVNALGLEMVEYNNGFSDITSEDWYAGFVATAEANGIVGGYTDGTFLPNKEISRLEMSTMLSNALSGVEVKDISKAAVNQLFSDSSDIAAWGKANVAKVYQEGLVVGMDGKFNPQGTTTRAQAATAIYRLYNK